MKKKRLLLPGLAVNALRRNGSTYLPYIGICTFAMFTFFVFGLIVHNDVTDNIPRAEYAQMLLVIGQFLLALIMIPFLYYTNSFLMKRRRKELGLYSILGMEKKHLGIMMFYETLLIYCVVVAGAVLLGLLFAKAVFLVLLNLIRLPAKTDFSVSVSAIAEVMVLFGIISAVNLSVNLFQVGRSDPAGLMAGARKGEKEPKLVGVWGLLGLLLLGGGYWIAVSAEIDRKIFDSFFGAVLLVIVGTYLLMTSGSILVLRFLKGKKSFYYKREHFITLSGMLYRMKKNAAGLANICIFSTMVIITTACTVSLYLGIPDIVRAMYPYRICAEWWAEGGFAEDPGLRDMVLETAKQEGRKLTDCQAYPYVCCKGDRLGDVIEIEDAFDEGEDCALYLLTAEQYAAAFAGAAEAAGNGQALPGSGTVSEGGQSQPGGAARLAEGEVMISWPEGDGSGQVQLAGRSFRVREYLPEFQTSALVLPLHVDKLLVVLADEEELQRTAAYYGADSAAEYYRVELNPGGNEEEADAFAARLEALYGETQGGVSFQDYKEDRLEEESLLGGLIFIGICFGLIFLICLLLIMYYKQVTEGFEDRENFIVLQKVGMEDGEVRRTVRRQILMVFSLPLAAAVLHTLAATRMVVRLMGAIYFYDAALIVAVEAGICVLFAVLYSICYRRTAGVYYAIVRRRGEA